MKVILSILFFLVLQKSPAQDSLYQWLSRIDCWGISMKKDDIVSESKLMVTMFPNNYPATIDNILGEYYLFTGDTINAERYYWHSINNDNMFTFCDSSYKQKLQFEAAFNLGKLYYRQNDYRKALAMLGLAMHRFRRGVQELQEGGNVFSKNRRSYRTNYSLWPNRYDSTEAKLQIAYSKALCYDKLGLKDSIIYELTPYMAEVREPRVIRLFLSLIIDLYGKEEAKKELQKGMQNLIYEVQYKSSDLCEGCYFIYINSSIPFFSSAIQLPVLSNGILVMNLGEVHNGQTKDALLYHFTGTPLYMLLMETYKMQ